MSRKVFISFLGTNNYVETHYEINGSLSTPVRFIQEALADYLCKDWTTDDKVLIFHTEEAFRRNWQDNGQDKITSDIEVIGLNSVLQRKKYVDIVEDVYIDEGFSEDEIWSIFNTVYSKLEDGDEIYFDVTHAFRSIPLFSTILFDFARFIKNATVKAVYYGAFEKLGPAYVVREMELKNRIAPIIDLTHLIKLQNLTQVANGFVEYGKIGKIGSILNSSDFSKKMAQTVSRLKQVIEKLDGYILTNRLKDIKEAKFVREINEYISQLLKSNELKKAETEILKKLQSRLSVFSENSEKNILSAIEWAYEHEMIAQTYTLAQEYIITLVCNKYSENNFYTDDNPKDKERNFRMFIGGVLGVPQKNIDLNLFEQYLSHNVEVARKLLSEKVIIEVRENYRTIANNRNTLNHAKNSNLTIVQFKEQFNKNFYQCLKSLEVC